MNSIKIYVELYTGKCDTINTGVIIEKIKLF